MRCPLVGEVYLAVGNDGFVGIFNHGASDETHAGGFGGVITYSRS